MKKTTASKGTIEDYLSSLPKIDRELLESIRKIIKTIVPDATEVISYGIPVFKYNGKYLVGYGPAKKFWSLYTMNGSFIQNHKDELGKYECTKSAIHFSMDKPIPVTLVKRIVKARIAENEQQANRKKVN